MNDKIDIGNVRGIKGDKGEKGDKGSTPSYDDLRYVKRNGEFVTVKGEGAISQAYIDIDGNLCDSEGHILDENGDATNIIGNPFDTSIYDYAYKPVWIDENKKFTNQQGDLLDNEGNLIYQKSEFIGDVATYIYDDDEGYGKLINDIYPNIVNTLISSTNNEDFQDFFNLIEGDIKYYICVDNPKLNITFENNTLSNTCRYKDGDGNIVSGSYVPLEKNTLYLYNANNSYDNEVMHYDIYLCKKANTVPIKLVSANDFDINYNVIDDFRIVPVDDEDEDGEREIYLELVTRGDVGQFYSMSEVDDLFDDHVDDKLGANNGIATLNASGKIPSTQLPSYVDDIIEGTMNSAGTTFTPSTQGDSVTEQGKIYVDVDTKKTYRYTGSAYVLISNPIVVDDGSTTAYSSSSGQGLATTIGNSSLDTTSQTLTGAINELNSNKFDSGDIGSANSGTSTNTSSSKLVSCADSRLSDARTPTSHNQALSTITDASTVAVTVTYTDNTTETLTLVKKV